MNNLSLPKIDETNETQSKRFLCPVLNRDATTPPISGAQFGKNVIIVVFRQAKPSV